MQRPGGNQPRPRSGAERDAAQPIAGQPRSGTEEEESGLENPDFVPSFLTARELRAKDPGKPADDEEVEDEAGGARGQPAASGEERTKKAGRGKSK